MRARAIRSIVIGGRGVFLGLRHFPLMTATLTVTGTIGFPALNDVLDNHTGRIDAPGTSNSGHVRILSAAVETIKGIPNARPRMAPARRSQSVFGIQASFIGVGVAAVVRFVDTLSKP